MEDGKYARSELLDYLIEEKNAIKKEFVFSKKIIKEFQDTIVYNWYKLLNPLQLPKGFR